MDRWYVQVIIQIVARRWPKLVELIRLYRNDVPK